MEQEALGGVDELPLVEGEELLPEGWLYESDGERLDLFSGGVRIDGGDEFNTSCVRGNDWKLRLGVTIEGDDIPAAICNIHPTLYY